MSSKKKNNNSSAPKAISTSSSIYELRRIQPMTKNQERVFDAFEQGKNLEIHGYAGTGKSFISIYLALKNVLTGKSDCNKIIIIRSAVPSRNIGFLKGSLEEKEAIYEEPYAEICDDLFSRSNAYNALKLRGVLEFTTTSYLRGKTFNNAIIIVDETQNMSFSELDTIMTRVGDSSRIVFCGDYRQTDLQKDSEKNGLIQFRRVLNLMDGIEQIEFEVEDIVRSGLVKEYIIKKAEAGY